MATTQINDMALQELLNWDNSNTKTLSEASGDLSVDIDSKFKQNAYRLKENLIKLRALDTSRNIGTAVEHNYGIIETYVKQQTLPLINRIAQLEKAIGHLLERNNQQPTEYIKDLEREKKEKERELQRFNLLLDDPSIVFSYVLEDYNIRGDANDFIANVINSDPYVKDHHQYFVVSNKGNNQIKEANVALALEVLNGNKQFYDELFRIRIIERSIEQLEDPDVISKAKLLNDNIRNYCIDYNNMINASNEERELRRKYDIKHHRDLRKQILDLQRQCQDYIVKLAQHLSYIRSNLQYFEKPRLGSVDLPSLFRNYTGLRKMAFTDSPINPFIYQHFSQFVNGELKKQFATELTAELEAQRKHREESLEQIPEEMRGANPDCVVDITDIGNPNHKYDRDSSIIALRTLLVINGLKKGAVYNKLISSDERTKIWEQVKLSIDAFINGRNDNNNRNR